MPRKRNKNKRIDYRSGGRVQFQFGGLGDGDIGLANFESDFNKAVENVDRPMLSKNQFFEGYKKANPFPTKRPGGAAGARMINTYNENMAKAYDDYKDGTIKELQKQLAEARDNPTGTQSTGTFTTSPALDPMPVIGDDSPDPSVSAPLPVTPVTGPIEPLSPPIVIPRNTGTIGSANPGAGQQGFNFSGAGKDLAGKILEEGFEKAQVERAGFQRDETGQLVLDSSGNPIPIAGPELIEMEAQPSLDRETFRVTTDTAEDTATVGTTALADTPTPITTATMDAALDAQQRAVQVAEGQVSQDALVADTLDISAVPTIDAAQVTVEEGAVTDRIVGTISEAAKAQAAQVTGQSLRRITRAKEQLRTAGISEETIASLGNDPEALELELTKLTDKERGLIEGLPREALVSTQINSLLEGIEEGEIPAWARPAVSAVEQVLAQRGLSASTVGRDNLFNAIIQSAVPIAQSNAQALQASIGQERDIEARVSLQDAQFRQQAALQNAQNVFSLDIAQFNADQQTALSNSKFFQTVSLTEASNRQQGIIQDAVLMSQRNLAEADINTRRQIQNAQTFLQMDLTNLNAQQQAFTLEAQQEHQRMLSNQSAINAARQFNASSENQTQQFMSELATRVDIANVQQMNAMQQFNTEQLNLAEARRVQNQVAIDTTNARIFSQIDIFNAPQEFERNKINTIAAQQIEQSNAQWRRQTNLADTAAQNQVNQQNAQNMFNLSSQANAMIWQELRDNADRDWKATQNERSREADIIATALSTENGGKWIASKEKLVGLLASIGYSGGQTAAEGGTTYPSYPGVVNPGIYY